MKERLRLLKNREMLFPLIWRSAVKLAVAAVLVLLWHHFANGRSLVNPVRYVLPVIGALYLFMAWLGFLRLDNVHMPRVFSYRKKSDQKKAGSLSDYQDTEPENDEDLSQDEKDVCAFASWLAAGVICLIAGFII